MTAARGGAPLLVVMVDWSAAASPRPRRPSPDACWLAYALHGDQDRPPPEYFRTRWACLDRLRTLVEAHDGPTLLGVDFSLGYPDGPDGEALLPVGRDLARRLAGALHEAPDGANDRFEVAAALNRSLAAKLGGPGPFWGCPARFRSAHLTPTRPASPAPEWRRVETVLRERGHRPHSTWKLYTTGSVGSQTLLGLAALGRWLDDPTLGPRLELWPFDRGFRRPRRRRAIVVGEAWPSLVPLPPPGRGRLAIKDARQVVALRAAALAHADPWTPLARPSGLDAAGVAQARREGWIMGLPGPVAPVR